MRAAPYAIATLAMLISACDSPGEDPADGGTTRVIELVGGAREILSDRRGPLMSPGIVRHPSLTVLDGAADGDRIALLVMLALDSSDPTLPENGARALLLSEDRGASFERVDLERVLGTAFLGVHLAGGRAYLVGLTEMPDWLGSDTRATPVIWPYDGGALGAPIVLSGWPIAFDGPRVAGLARREVLGRGAFVEHGSFDASSQRADTWTDGDDSTGCEWVYDSDDGRRWRRWCYTIDERCTDTIEADVGPTVTRACVPASAWSVPQTAAQGPIAIAGDVYMAHYTGGRSFLTPPPDVGGSPIDLGPGFASRIDHRDAWAHPAMARLLALRDFTSNAPRLVAVEGRTVREVGIERTPCARAEDCGADTLVRLVELGTNEWLAVYVLSVAEDDRRVVVRIAHDGEAPPAILAPDLPELARRPTEPLLVSSALETTCARAAVCFPTTSVQACVQRWLAIRGLSTEADAAYQRFVTTGPTCDAFRETDRELAYTERPCATGCFDDVAVTCDVRAPTAIDCRLRGTTCRTTPEGVATCGDPMGAACDACDASGRAIECWGFEAPLVTDCAAEGLTCMEGVLADSPPIPRCSPSTCSYPEGTCEGDVIVHCAPPAILERLDCARVGMRCRNARCDQPGRVEPTCVDDGSSACDGAFLTYCMGGGPRAIDCRAIGYTGCFAAGSIARCVP